MANCLHKCGIRYFCATFSVSFEIPVYFVVDVVDCLFPTVCNYCLGFQLLQFISGGCSLLFCVCCMS